MAVREAFFLSFFLSNGGSRPTLFFLENAKLVALRENIQEFSTVFLSLSQKREGGEIRASIRACLTLFSLSLSLRIQASSSSSASSPRGDAIDAYAVPVLVTSSSSSSDRGSTTTTERVYRNAAHKDQLLRGFPFPNDDCKTLGDIWESAFKKYPNKAFLG